MKIKSDRFFSVGLLFYICYLIQIKMENVYNLSNAELLSDFRHIETHLHQAVFEAQRQKNIFHTQGTLISEIVRLAQAATTSDQTANLKRALTSFIKL